MLLLFFPLLLCQVHSNSATTLFVTLPTLFDFPSIQNAVLTEINLGTRCRQQMDLFLKTLKPKEAGNQSDTRWAQIMWDASGRYMGSLDWGSSFWLGSYSHCTELSESTRNPTPFSITYYVSKLQLRLYDFKQIRPISIGVCWPTSCSTQAISKILSRASKGAGVILGTRSVPGNPEFKLWMESTFYLLLFVSFFMSVLVFSSTFYYEMCRRDQKRKMKEMEMKQRDAIAAMASAAAACCDSLDMTIPESDLSEYNSNHLSYTSHGPTISTKPNPITLSTESSEEDISTPGREIRRLLPDVLLGCAIQTSILKITSSSKKEPLACLHGLRVFSLVWVIAGHACMFAFPFADNRKFRQLVERDFLFQSISNGAFSVDTFFVISGLLIAYIYFKKTTEKDNTRITFSSTSTSSVTSTIASIDRKWYPIQKPIVDFFGIVSYRFLRLTPPYLIVLGIVELTTKWFHFNSVFDPPTLDHENCPKYWWRNILYINTLFPVKNMCMIWSWYLSNDTQFYILGIILLMISSKSFRVAIVFLLGFLICSWITTATIVINTKHIPSIEEPLGLFDEIYDKPWTRLAPYLIGMATGYLLQKTNCILKLHKGWVSLGWSLCISMTFILVHGLYGRLGVFASAAYATLSHTAWGLCVAWIIIACATGHGGVINSILSSKMMHPLSRITYCAYLLHPLIMISVIMHMDAPIHLGRDTMIITIFGYITTSYLFSFVFSVIFEAPVIALLNIIHPIKRK